MLRLYIHPDNPQTRLIQQTVEHLNHDAVVIAPSDAGYVLMANANSKTAVEKILKIRQLNDKYQCTLLCQDLADFGHYAEVNNQAFRLLKANDLTAMSFVFTATKNTPKRLIHSKNKTIALRLANDNICKMLVEQFEQPLFISSLIMPNQDEMLADPEDIALQLEKLVDIFLDTGYNSSIPCSIVDFSQDNAQTVRYGLADVNPFI